METENSKNKIETLFGGRVVSVMHEDGTAEEIRAGQIRIADYEKAAVLLDDEFALVATACGKTRDWLNSLTGESYEQLHAAVREVNERGFFAFADRQRARKEQMQQSMIAAVSALGPDSMKLVMEEGKKLTSPTSSPRS